jgi:hypothetical protein
MEKAIGAKSGAYILDGFCEHVERGDEVSPFIKHFLYRAFSHIFSSGRHSIRPCDLTGQPTGLSVSRS